MAAKQNVEVEGRSLALSNLDKVLYPASGFTKAQVIDYYIRIAPWLLPHFSKRPVGFSLKALLEANGLQCFAKVSGSKGLQVYVPLNTKVTYEQTRSFAQSVAAALERQNPKLVVSEMAKNLRHGKIFIDWSQNSDFKTTIGVYSLRAKGDQPFVSMPVTWDELAEFRRGAESARLLFLPEAALKRAEAKGDLFASLL